MLFPIFLRMLLKLAECPTREQVTTPYWGSTYFRSLVFGPPSSEAQRQKSREKPMSALEKMPQGRVCANKQVKLWPVSFEKVSFRISQRFSHSLLRRMGNTLKTTRQSRIPIDMKANNYEVVEAGETIKFRGIVQRSLSQAFFLVFCTALAFLSLGLVLQIQFQDLGKKARS